MRTTAVFIDTNVFVYAVGRAHPLREPARQFVRGAVTAETPCCTSAEVLQELLHIYLPVGRHATLDAAMQLVRSITSEIFAIDADDIWLARALAGQHPGLGARDLVHLATCQRRGVTELKTFDRGLAAAFGNQAR